MKRDYVFDALSVGCIIFLSLLMVAWWERYPIFVDIYYHLSVMRGFDTAGGIVLHDFWEFAPYGRAHLYPPLLHIIMLGLYKTGLSVDFIGRLVSFILFPAQLMSLYIYMRYTFSSKAAFFSILILSTPLAYLWANSVISASALVLFFAPLLFLAIEKDKKIASSLLLALSLYSHLGIAHTTAIALILYGLIAPQKRIICFATVIAGYILYLPWGIHVLFNISYLNRRFDSSIVDPSTVVYLSLLLLALLGTVIALKKREEKFHLVPLCYIGAMVPVMFTAPNRFWLSCGGLPFAMLGGIGLAAITDKIECSTGRKSASLVFAGIIFLSLLLFNPTLRFMPQRGVEMRNEYPLLPSLFAQRFSQMNNLWDQDTERLIELVRRNTSEDDILSVSHPPLGSLLTAYTGRAQTDGMFREVLPYRNVSQKDASLVIIEKGSRQESGEGKKVAEIGRFVVYENDTESKRIVEKPVLPTSIAFLILLFALMLIVGDAFRRG